MYNKRKYKKIISTMLSILLIGTIVQLTSAKTDTNKIMDINSPFINTGFIKGMTEWSPNFPLLWAIVLLIFCKIYFIINPPDFPGPH